MAGTLPLIRFGLCSGHSAPLRAPWPRAPAQVRAEGSCRCRIWRLPACYQEPGTPVGTTSVWSVSANQWNVDIIAHLFERLGHGLLHRCGRKAPVDAGTGRSRRVVRLLGGLALQLHAAIKQCLHDVGRCQPRHLAQDAQRRFPSGHHKERGTHALSRLNSAKSALVGTMASLILCHCHTPSAWSAARSNAKVHPCLAWVGAQCGPQNRTAFGATFSFVKTKRGTASWDRFRSRIPAPSLSPLLCQRRPPRAPSIKDARQRARHRATRIVAALAFSNRSPTSPATGGLCAATAGFPAEASLNCPHRTLRTYCDEGA